MICADGIGGADRPWPVSLRPADFSGRTHPPAGQPPFGPVAPATFTRPPLGLGSDHPLRATRPATAITVLRRATGRMIIDAHAYCFEAWDSPRGFASADEHLALVAEGNAGHHQPALRLSDGAAADAAASAALTRRSMRLDKRRGRITWDDPAGISFTKHFAPPNLVGCAYSPYQLDGEMLYAGVDAALLHTNDMLVRDPTYYRDVIAAFPPGRFYAMAPSDERLITTDCPAAIRAIQHGARDCGLSAIKFHVNTWQDCPTRWNAMTNA